MENENAKNETRLSDLLAILKKCWWLMLIVCIIATSVSYAYMKVTYQPRYTATVSIWVLKGVGTESGFQSTDVSIATYLVNDYKSLMTNDAVVERIQASDPAWQTLSLTQLRSRVSIKHVENTRILDVTVTSTTKEGAKKLADAWGNTFCSYINDEKMNGEQMVTMVGEARMPEKPANPMSFIKALLLGVACAAVIYAIYFIQALLDDTINNADDVEHYLGLTLLGSIPNKHSAKSRNKYRSKYSYQYYEAGGKSGRK